MEPSIFNFNFKTKTDFNVTFDSQVFGDNLHFSKYNHFKLNRIESLGLHFLGERTD